MIVSFHVATGAAAGALVRSRAAAVALGPLLHYAADVVPHQDVASRRFEIRSGLGCLALLAARRGPLSPEVLGGAAAASPDLEHVLRFLRFGGRKHFPTHLRPQLHRRRIVPVWAQLLAAGALVGLLAAPRGDRRASVSDDFLRIYLNDQLALGVVWREVARRSARANRGTELGEAVARVAEEIAEDVETFERIMERLAIRKSAVKPALARAAERLGRLKLNGRLVSYSPLSRFVELEFLAMGIEGKKVLWTTLRDLAGLGERLPDVDFDALIERAERQRAALEPLRAQAGRDALRA